MKKKLLKQKLQMLYKVNDDLRKSQAIKVLELSISFVEKAIELKKIQIPEYKKEGNNIAIVNLSDVKGKTFQEVWDEIKPKDIINAMEEKIKKECDHEYVTMPSTPISFFSSQSAVCRKCGHRP